MAGEMASFARVLDEDMDRKHAKETRSTGWIQDRGEQVYRLQHTHHHKTGHHGGNCDSACRAMRRVHGHKKRDAHGRYAAEILR